MYLLEEVAQQKLDRLNITKYYEESLIDMEKVKKAEADIEKHKKATAEKWNVWSGKFQFRIQTNLNPASKLNWHCVEWNFLFPVPAKKLFSVGEYSTLIGSFIKYKNLLCRMTPAQFRQNVRHKIEVKRINGFISISAVSTRLWFMQLKDCS